jgi:site-specific DNA recombinase
VVVSPTSLTIHLNRAALLALLGPTESGLEGPITLETETRFKRGGRGLRFVIPGPQGSWSGAHRDKPLIQAVARGTLWYDLLISGQVKSRDEIARANGFSGQHVARHIQLAWLAPDIVEAILDGHQPKQLTVQRLLEKLPMDWTEQRRALGFEVKSPRN